MVSAQPTTVLAQPSAGVTPRELAPSWLGASLTSRQVRRGRALYAGPASGPHASTVNANTAMTSVRLAFESAYTAGYVASWQRCLLHYETFCALIRVSPYPVTAGPLMMFLADRVIRLKREPTGCGAVLSALRSGVELKRLGWELDALDDKVLRMVRRGLTKTYKGQAARGKKKPLRLAHLDVMHRARDRDNWPAGPRQLLLQAQMAHGGLLRTAEHAGTGASSPLRVGQVQFLVEDAVPGSRVRFLEDRRDLVGLRLILVNAKTGKLDAVPQTALVGRRVDHLDVVGPLYDYFISHGLFAPERRMEPLFCALNLSGQRVVQSPITGALFRQGLTSLLVAAGIPTSGFGGHSPRRGGCNDLFDGGLPVDMVSAAGRWKSLAWMEYRDLTSAAMKAMAAVPVQMGVHPLGESSSELLSVLKTSLSEAHGDD